MRSYSCSTAIPEPPSLEARGRGDPGLRFLLPWPQHASPDPSTAGLAYHLRVPRPGLAAGALPCRAMVGARVDLDVLPRPPRRSPAAPVHTSTLPGRGRAQGAPPRPLDGLVGPPVDGGGRRPDQPEPRRPASGAPRTRSAPSDAAQRGSPRPHPAGRRRTLPRRRQPSSCGRRCPRRAASGRPVRPRHWEVRTASMAPTWRPRVADRWVPPPPGPTVRISGGAFRRFTSPHSESASSEKCATGLARF